MAQKGDDNFNKDVEKAVKAGSDFSQGGEFAYKALISELAHDQRKYATDPAKFDELGTKVAAGLEKTGTIDDHMLRWSRDNMGRFDTSGDGEVDKHEINPRNHTKLSGFEMAMMLRLQNQYEALNKSDSIQPITGSRDAADSFSPKDFKKLVDAREQPIDEQSVSRPVDSAVEKSTDGAVAITDPKALSDRGDGTGPAIKKETAPVDATVVPAERQEKPTKKEIAPAAKPFEAPKPIPELVIPEIKLDGDLVKARAELAKSASEHFQARAVYTVRPGQGWDRIARDVLRQEKDGSHTNESLVVALSDHVAKGNGWEGRLDPTKMLHPGDKVRVMTDEAVKARTEDILKQFDAKVAEMQKAAAAAKPVDNGDPALFDGKRSGEGDVDPAATAKKEPAPAPEIFDGNRNGGGVVKPEPAADTLKEDSGNSVLDGSEKPVKTEADSTLVPNPKAIEEPVPEPVPEPAPEQNKAGTNPQLKASNDTTVAPVVAGNDVASPGEDFAVTAVSADTKAEAEYQAKQKAARDKRLVQGSNPLESFEAPNIG